MRVLVIGSGGREHA
ncbi:MAG TPA: hypothetical protein DEA22_04525, partial [Blastocatellia bacterium]|nr:hypothetical protein [Blastocatellia bacterium]